VGDGVEINNFHLSEEGFKISIANPAVPGNKSAPTEGNSCPHPILGKYSRMITFAVPKSYASS
jgi:hypothetical protein